MHLIELPPSSELDDPRREALEVSAWVGLQVLLGIQRSELVFRRFIDDQKFLQDLQTKTRLKTQRIQVTYQTPTEFLKGENAPDPAASIVTGSRRAVRISWTSLLP